MNSKQIKAMKAVEAASKYILARHFGFIPEDCGIYILTRRENGFKYAYVGQAKRILTRMAEHMRGYQHIDLSIRKHGFYSKDNEKGWQLWWAHFPEHELDEKEQEYIKQYANLGYQMRNKTAGGQGQGKFDIAETPKKGYQQGLHKGYENAQKDVAKWFAKNLTYSINGAPNKHKEKALQRFEEFLQGGQKPEKETI